MSPVWRGGNETASVRQPGVEIVLAGVRAPYASRASPRLRVNIPDGLDTRGPVPRARALYPPSSKEEPEMGDVIYVALVVAAFAVLALIVKGVERLER
jgi:hypothetical protein